MTAAISHTGRPFRRSTLLGLTKQNIAFIAFYVFMCTPAFLAIGTVSLSILIFPLVIYGYSRSAWDTFPKILPGARDLAAVMICLIIAFCVWALVTAIGAADFVRVFRPLYGHASGLTILIAVLALSRTPEEAGRVRLYCIVLLVVALSLTYVLGPRGYGDRYPGTFKHPNQLGIVATLATIYLICMVLASRGKARLWAVVGSVISLLAMMLSGSKTNLVIFTAISPLAVFMLAFLRRDTKAAASEITRNMVMIVAIILVGGISLATLNARAFNVLDDLTGGEEELGTYHSVVSRNDLWRESWQMFEKYPMTGVGSGQLLTDGTEHSHNVFLDTLRTTGAPGFALITAFILAMLWFVVASYRAGRILSRDPVSRLSDESARGPFVGSLLALVIYILANQMSDSFGPSTIPFFYMFFAFTLTFMLPGSLPRAAGVRSGNQAAG